MVLESGAGDDGVVGVYLYGTSITVYGLRSINEVLRDFQQADA